MSSLPLTPRQEKLLISLAQSLRDGLGTTAIVSRGSGGIGIKFVGGEINEAEGWNDITEADLTKFTQLNLLHSTNQGKHGPTNYTLDEYSIKAAAEAIQQQSEITEATENKTMTKNPKDVFVVHGRNEQIRISMFRFLRSIELTPREFPTVVANGSPYVGDAIAKKLSEAQAVIVLLTPDEIVWLHPSYQGADASESEPKPNLQPRPNVFFEAGMAMSYMPTNTIIVQIGKVRLFSDIFGRHIIRFKDDTGSKDVESRQELAQRLENAGCTVIRTGTDWLSEGDFIIDDEIYKALDLINSVDIKDSQATKKRALHEVGVNTQSDSAIDDDLPYVVDVDYPKVIKRWRVTENELIHDAGKIIETGEWMIVTPDPQGRGTYGPYIKLEPNKYKVTFRLKITDNSGDNGQLSTIDVVSRKAGKDHEKKIITVWDFIASDKYQDFNLEFELPSPDVDFEFRVRTDQKFEARRRLLLDYVELKSQ